MDFNPQVRLAEQYVTETGVSLFLTGKAGTGKTTFLHHIAAHCPKRHVVVAPTGVAAVNAGGVTIHSFFQLPFCPYLPDVPELVTEYQLPEHQRQLRKSKIDIIRTLDLLIIDEISMVRADLLDAVDALLRRYRRSSRPFGGVQLLMIGDVQQLSPVVTDEERPYMDRVYPSPFFFHSKALSRLPYVTIQLTTIYRQQDPTFVTLLNNIRDNRFDPQTLAALNTRVHNPSAPSDSTGGREPILLTTHNWQADEVNQRHMDALDTPCYAFDALVEGNFPDTSAPTPRHLELKIGAQVMFVKNDSTAHRYYNGMIGTVQKVVDGDDSPDGTQHIVVENEEGEQIFVSRERWENIRYEIDPADNQIKQQVDGTFTQYPLKTAWAITIHKAQGLTFDRVQVNASAAFTYGQVYVALSRCRSLQGLTLLAPITPRNAFGSDDIEHFNGTLTPPDQAAQMLANYRKQHYFDLLFELFDFSSLQHAVEGLRRLFNDHLSTTYPAQAALLTDLCGADVENLTAVAERFRRQLATIGQQPDGQAQPLIQQRVDKATVYFRSVLSAIDTRVQPLLAVEIDNKETRSRLADLADHYRKAMGLKQHLLQTVGNNGFDIAAYQQAKADFELKKQEKPKRDRTPRPFANLPHPQLAARLSDWRRNTADELSLPPYAIMQQKTLLEIVERLPTSTAQLKLVTGLGKKRLSLYGDAILQVVTDYCRDNGIKSATLADPPKPEPPAPRNGLWREAARLVVEGKSPEQAARELNRALSTTEGYLIQAVEQGVLPAEALLPSEGAGEIVAFMTEHPEITRLKEVYEHFDQRYTYLQLRVARHLASEL